MNEGAGKGWRREDAEAIAGETAARVTEALERSAPEGLDADGAAELRRRLIEVLPGEAAQDARRICRRFGEERARAARERRKAEARRDHHEKSVERLTLHLRAQHMVLFASCIVLILTGLPIKFSDWAPFAWVTRMAGRGLLHNLHMVGAIGLTGIALYHLFYTALSELGRRDFGLLIMKPQDAKDALGQILYFLGIRKEKPLYGRFSYIEKFDYWAVYWGMVVMLGSGYILWSYVPESTIGGLIPKLPKSVFDIAREAHSDEALLATLAIVVWHFYNVHFNPKRFPGSLTWWNGKITLEEFKEEHPLEYEEWRSEGKLSGEDEEGGSSHPAPAGEHR
jgi:formate dehydrogenase subunit gamma